MPDVNPLDGTNTDATPNPLDGTGDAGTPPGDTPPENKQEGAGGDAGGKKDAPKDGGEAGSGKPVDIKLTVPEGLAADDATVQEFTTLAKELALAPEAAQKLFERSLKTVHEAAAAEQKAFDEQKAAWWKSTLSDKEIGGDKAQENLAIAKRGMETYASPDLQKFLREMGLTNHPEFVRLFYKVGTLLQEDRSPASGAPASSGQRRPTEQVLYPSMSK